MDKNISFNEYKEMFDRNKQDPFKTPWELFEKGVVLCDKCGKHCSLDYKYCSKCQDFILVTISKYGKHKRIPDR